MRDAAMRGRDLVRMEEGRKEAKDEMWSGGGALGDGKVVAWWWPPGRCGPARVLPRKDLLWKIFLPILPLRCLFAIRTHPIAPDFLSPTLSDFLLAPSSTTGPPPTKMSDPTWERA